MEEKYMKEALKEAQKAYDKLEIPVGAVIVKDGKIIARAHNQKETKFDTTKHAEILAIQKASKKLKSWRLLDCEMYVTLEPCSMCAGAIINSRIKKVYIGTMDEKTGAVGSVFNLFEDYTFNHKVEFETGVLKEECENILKRFFKELRKIKKLEENKMPKALHISIIALIIVAIGFTAVMLILRYDEKGEENMPFDISKISIISSINGQDVEDDDNLWNKSVGQDNDIYIYIEKNDNYKKTETIEKIVLNNFKISQKPQKGELTIYKPSNNEKELFENINENKAEEIIFTGEQLTKIKELKISNQGGIVAFRLANQNIGKYVSNDNEIDYKDLLKKINIKEEDIKANISFDVNIVLADSKQFKSTIDLELPAEGIVESGKSSIEFMGKDFVFKRIEN